MQNYNHNLIFIFFTNSPLHKLNHDKVTAVSRVKQHQTIGAGGLELEEEVHGGVSLQGGQRHITGSIPEADRIGHDAAHAEAGIELAVGDVTILALV